MIPRLAAITCTGFATAALVAGCSSPDKFDGVLWRQMDAVKQPVFAAFDETLDLERTAILDDIVSDGGTFPGYYFDHSESPEVSARSGGVFLSRLVEGADWASLNVLLSSGPRNAASDPLAKADQYRGAPGIYTCFQAVVQFEDHRVARWIWDEEAECDPDIVATLDEKAQFEPLYRFSG